MGEIKTGSLKGHESAYVYCLFMGLRVIDQWGLGSTIMAVVMPDEPAFVLKRRQKPERGTTD